MSEVEINAALVREFEAGLDPRFPEKNRIPARVLGYGEISTVLEIGTGHDRDLAYKRLSMFRTEAEIDRYEALYREYVRTLQDRIGLKLIPSDTIRIVDAERGKVVLYIVQEKLPVAAIGHKAIHLIPPGEIQKLMRAVLREFKKVFEFNRENGDELAVGFDGQISNWAVDGFDPDAGRLPETISLTYLDTSTPLLQRKGEEQLNPDLFLRSAPSFLTWIIRLFFLKDVMTRYYDFRRVAVDLIANFYKEQLPGRIPDLIETVNGFLSTASAEEAYAPITQKEVRAYYREDAWIWRLYLTFRNLDRSLHRLLGKEYPYILPGRIKR
jgi:hypothetical protein